MEEEETRRVGRTETADANGNGAASEEKEREQQRSSGTAWCRARTWEGHGRSRCCCTCGAGRLGGQARRIRRAGRVQEAVAGLGKPVLRKVRLTMSRRCVTTLANGELLFRMWPDDVFHQALVDNR